MIAGLDAGYAGAHLFYDSAALVAEDGGKGALGIVPGQGVGVGVADAGRDDAHQRLAFARTFNVHVLDSQRLSRGPGYGCACFHWPIPLKLSVAQNCKVLPERGRPAFAEGGTPSLPGGPGVRRRGRAAPCRQRNDPGSPLPASPWPHGFPASHCPGAEAAPRGRFPSVPPAPSVLAHRRQAPPRPAVPSEALRASARSSTSAPRAVLMSIAPRRIRWNCGPPIIPSVLRRHGAVQRHKVAGFKQLVQATADLDPQFAGFFVRGRPRVKDANALIPKPAPARFATALPTPAETHQPKGLCR